MPRDEKPISSEEGPNDVVGDAAHPKQSGERIQKETSSHLLGLCIFLVFASSWSLHFLVNLLYLLRSFLSRARSRLQMSNWLFGTLTSLALLPFPCRTLSAATFPPTMPGPNSMERPPLSLTTMTTTRVRLYAELLEAAGKPGLQATRSRSRTTRTTQKIQMMFGGPSPSRVALGSAER